MAAMELTSTEEMSVKMNEDIDDVISEKVKMEFAQQEVRLEEKLTAFQKMIDEKMADLEFKIETQLLSKYEEDFKNLEEKLLKQMKPFKDFHRKFVTKKYFLKMKGKFKDDLNKHLKRQCKEVKKLLQESSKSFIEGVLDVKCEDIERKSFSNLEVKCKTYSEEIKNHFSNDVENLKKDLKKDFVTQNEDLKKNLQEKLKEEIKTELSDGIELKLKQHFENERTILLEEIKSEVNLKRNEIKLNSSQELKEELTKCFENEKCDLEEVLTTKCESEKSKTNDELKNVLSSEMHCEFKTL